LLVPEKKTSLGLARFGCTGVTAKQPNMNLPDMTLASTCDCKKINSMFSAFDSQKARIVRSIGFDGLLKLPLHENLNHDLSLWLYKRLDFETMTLQLDGGVQLPLRNVDVHLILGIPFEGTVHQAKRQSREAVTAFKKKLSIDGIPATLTLSYLEYVLLKDYGPEWSEDEMDPLKIAIVMYSVCYFLAPEMRHEFPASILCNFIPVVHPEKINWAQLVMWTLSRAAISVQSQLTDENNKVVLFGCSLLLQVQH
jgi:hypothetical protein